MTQAASPRKFSVVDLGVGALCLATFVLAWELTGRNPAYSYSIRPPSLIYEALTERGALADLLWHSWVSTVRVVYGFAAATLVGVPLGILAGTTRFGRAAMAPFITILRPLPSMSWIPLSIIWFGPSEGQKEFIVFMGSLPPIMVYTIAAMGEIDPLLVRAAQNLGARPMALIREVIFPASLPSVLAGLRVAFAVSWTCVISAELVLTSDGLGYLIMKTRETGNFTLTYAGMLAIVVTVMVLTYLFEFLEWAVMPWRRGDRHAWLPRLCRRLVSWMPRPGKGAAQ